MEPLAKKRTMTSQKKEKNLFSELDRGIDNMENDCTIPHKEAMEMIREGIKSYDV